MANKMVLILVAAAVAIIIAGTAVAIPSFMQQNTPVNNDMTSSAEPGSVLKLSSASVLIDIPLIKGYENGNEIFFIGTDVSDEDFAAMGTNRTGFKVNHAVVKLIETVVAKVAASIPNHMLKFSLHFLILRVNSFDIARTCCGKPHKRMRVIWVRSA